MEKIKQWIVSHKLWSIVIASALVVCITLAIVLPITLSHKHSYSEDWSTDATYHWHACEGKKCDEIKDKAEHTYGNWSVKTAAGQGVDIVKERTCEVCGCKQEQTVSNTRLESHNTLVMLAKDFSTITLEGSNKLCVHANILNGKVAVGDKLKVDGYDQELTVERIGREGNNEVDEIDYNYTGDVDLLFQEVVSEKPANGSYITKSGAPVQRYTKLTLTIKTAEDKEGAFFKDYKPQMTIAGKTVKINVIDVVNTTPGSELEYGVPGKGGTGTITVTVFEGEPVLAWVGMEIVANEGKKIVFTGTVAGVLTD